MGQNDIFGRDNLELKLCMHRPINESLIMTYGKVQWRDQMQ